MKLSKERNEQMCQRIKELEGHPIKEITKIINSEFKVDYDRSSIKYWYYKVFKPKSTRKDEELMEKWRSETNEPLSVPKEELLAEKLFDLFNENISESEFDSKLLSN